MSTLADLTLDPSVVKSALYRRVNGDATLEGATYLGSAGKIVAQEKAPRNIAPPRLHILLELIPDIYTATALANWTLIAVVKNPELDVVGDRARAGRILKRAGQLMVGPGVFTDAALRFFDSWVDGIGELTVDPQALEQSQQALRGRFRVRKV